MKTYGINPDNAKRVELDEALRALTAGALTNEWISVEELVFLLVRMVVEAEDHLPKGFVLGNLAGAYALRGWSLDDVLRQLEALKELTGSPGNDPYAALPLEQALKAFDEDTHHPRSWRACLGERGRYQSAFGTIGFNGQCITFTPDRPGDLADGYPTYEVASDTLHELEGGVIALREPPRALSGRRYVGVVPRRRG